VVIGGIISSTILTLLVLPALYSLVHGRPPRPEGARPGWLSRLPFIRSNA
jgi:heavy metal efflux system protein